MGLETGTYISDLVITNPVSADPKSQGDDHLRLLKSTIKTTFPGVTGAVTPTHTELNYVDGVTSAIQTQLDLKAPLANPVLTGTPSAPTADVGATGTQIATLDYVIATSLAGTLPGQTGNAGKYLGTDGTNGAWYSDLDTAVIVPIVGTKIATTTATESLSNKSLTTPVLQDSADTTKKANLILSGVTAGQNRNITIGDENMTLFTPSARLIGTVTASNSASVDLETYFSATYDDYIITITNLSHAEVSARNLYCTFKKAGSYLATGYRYREFDNSFTSSAARIIVMNSIQNDTDTEMVWLQFDLSRPLETGREHFLTIRGAQSTCSNMPVVAGGNSALGALQGIRFTLSGGNIKTGTFNVFGVRKT